MNYLDKNIEKIASEIADLKGFFIVDLVLRGHPQNRIIEVYVDGEQNVTAEVCAEISHEIKEKLDEAPEMRVNYRLDVSSPGVDRPFKYIKQFPKHINRKFEVEFNSGDDRKKLTGKLLRVEDNLLWFETKEGEEVVNFNNVIKAKVIVSF